jgi:hypothetical protein
MRGLMSAKPDQLKEFMPISGIGPQSFGWKPWQSDQEEAPRQAPPQSESSQCCAYNQTSQRFLSVDVEAGDFTPSSLETRLQTLSPTGNVGLFAESRPPASASPSTFSILTANTSSLRPSNRSPSSASQATAVPPQAYWFSRRNPSPPQVHVPVTNSSSGRLPR